MRRAIGLIGPIGLIGLLAAAWSPESWLRRGNAAYARGDYRAALDCFVKAGEETDDPGQVAVDQAAAHYQLGEYGEAETCYRRSLEDAAGARRVRALYGLANALAQEGQLRRGRAAVLQLTDAVQQYKACLDAAAAVEPAEQERVGNVRDDAQFNLNLVKALLERKLADTSTDNPPTTSENPDAQPDDRNSRQGTREAGAPGTESDGNRPRERRGTPGSETQMPPGGQPQPTDETQPGKGNVPLLDDKDAAPLSPDQALDYLLRNLDRIRQGRANRMPPQPANAKVLKDW